MDNICHTLVGAACGAAGLNRRTRFGAATLMISANIPDLDVLVFATGMPWIEFRRGWTHGVVAQIVLPVALTGMVWLFDRVWRGRGAEGNRPFHAGWTLLLAFVGVYSHVFLDYLNNYGVRLATPIDWQWFYGDAIFIIDPWMWIMMAAGVWLAGSRGRPRPARVALIAMSCYIAAMLISGWAARGIVTESWKECARHRPACPDGRSLAALAIQPAGHRRRRRPLRIRHILLVATGSQLCSREDSQEQRRAPGRAPRAATTKFGRFWSGRGFRSGPSSQPRKALA